MNKNIIIAVVIVALVALGLIFMGKSGTSTPLEQTATTTTSQVPMKEYRNDTYGISFSYPETYLLTEEDKQDAGGAHHFIVLAEDTPFYRSLLDGTNTTATEGPASIIIKVYTNAAATQTPADWIKTNPASNVQFSTDGKVVAGTIAGTEALLYHWSGLYEADNYVLAHKNNIISIISTWGSADEPIRKGFSDILKSLELQ